MEHTIDFIWKYVFYSVFHKIWPSSREDEDYRAISLINRFYYFLYCWMHHSTLFVISRFTSIFRRSPLPESCSTLYFLSLPLHLSFSRIHWRTYIRTYIHTYTHTYIHTHIHTYIHTDMHMYIYIHGTYINTWLSNIIIKFAYLRLCPSDMRHFTEI